MEYWVEVNLDAAVTVQDRILLDVLRPYVEGLERRSKLITWHFFREPEIRFRVRLKTAKERKKQVAAVSKMAESLRKKGLVEEWHFGNHGEAGNRYRGEADRYGRNGWKVAQKYFRDGSETALELLALKRESKLESPLWAKGLGNPWEGGEQNPWREREEDPLVYNWSRFVHLFTNQLGFDMEKEAELCAKQSERYKRVMEFGMRW
jgi:Lantibiotic biosynthesis dehydratase C-term